MWTTVFFILAFLSLFFNAKAITIGLFTVGLLYFGGGKLLEVVFAKIRVTRPADRTYVFPGETARISIHFHNPTVIPLAWVSGVERLPMRLAGKRSMRWLVSLPPKSSMTVSYEIKPSRRGVYTVGPVDMHVGDPLGLHRRSGTSQSFHDVVVYPEVLAIDQLGLPSNLAVGNVKGNRRIYPDPTRLAGVRQYRQGDPKQWVHWKVTARTGELHVKQFDHSVTLDSFIILNFNERDYKIGVRWHDMELAVTTAASLAHYLATLNEPFGLMTNAPLQYHGTIQPLRTQRPEEGHVVRVMPRRGSNQLMQVLEILAAAHCEPCENFVEMLGREAKHFSWGATLLLVTPVDSPELVQTSLLLSASGYRVFIFVTGETVHHSHLLQPTGYQGVQAFHVRRGSGVPLFIGGGDKAG